MEFLTVNVNVRVAPHGEGIDLPSYMTDGSAGMDLRAAVSDSVLLGPGDRALIPTGIHLELPSGYEAQVRPRSGLAIKYGLSLLNSPGTIDSDYRGEIKVILVNLGSDPVTVSRGDRVAQLVVAPVARATLQIVDELSRTVREDGGFGHTGH